MLNIYESLLTRSDCRLEDRKDEVQEKSPPHFPDLSVQLKETEVFHLQSVKF